MLDGHDLQQNHSSTRLTRQALTRLEGLGDNCELGFVLRRAGFEDGMLFRWASIRPESLLATLRGDFDRLYEFANLEPQNRKMVHDRHYGTAWHSEMHSSLRDGRLCFDAGEAERGPIHAKEASKLGYMVAKFRRKLDHPNPVFVLKANAAIPEPVLEAIHYQLYRRARSPHFLLLEVCADPARAGRVERRDRHLLRGFLPAFAAYDRADEGDDASWHSILAQALATGSDMAEPGGVVMEPGRLEPVALAFPQARPPDLRVPIDGDLRAGMPRVIRANSWCRPMDDVYRLHATGFGAEATALCWTGVHLPPGHAIELRAGCAIVESMPVRAVLTVASEAGERTSCETVFASMEDREVTLPIPPRLANPLTVTLAVEPVAALRLGERAVIDIQSVQATARINAAAQMMDGLIPGRS